MFNPIEEVENILNSIEGKHPADLLDFFDKKEEYLKENGITTMMHIGETNWTLLKASEWLLSMFIGIIQQGRVDKLKYNTLDSWAQHVVHFIIKNNNNLK